jgi:hypothetical protein
MDQTPERSRTVSEAAAMRKHRAVPLTGGGPPGKVRAFHCL